jgi:hypothetical protein
VVEGARYFPFCSERCRWVDLGRWLEGDYRVPLEPSGDEKEAEKPGKADG